MAIDEMFPNDRSLAAESLGGTAVPGATPQGDGMLGGIMPMLVQYLSAAGQDIGAGKPIGANVNAATQKNLAAQSQTKLLKKVLAGGGKVVMDGNKFQISGGSHLLEGGDGAAGTGASTKPSSAPGETTNTPNTGASIMSKILGGNVSQDPTSSPLGDINANDLVGLTPENISGALALKQRQDALSQESVNSQFDNLYKFAKTRELADSGIFPVQVPGVGAVSYSQWKALPADTRSYAAYVHQSKQANPTEPVMSFQDFKRIPGDTQLRYLEELMKDPAKMAAAKELRRAGATTVNVGDKVEVANAMQDVKDRRYFSDPKGGLSKDIEDHMKSMPVMMQTARHKVGTREHGKASATIRENYFKKKLAAAGGEIVSGKVDGKDSVWTVKWRDGKTSEVRYGN